MPVSGAVATTTVQDLVDETRFHLMGGMPENLNILAGGGLTADENDTNITFSDDITGIGRGTELEIGRERMYVRSADSGAKTAVLIRAHGRSDVAAHTDGDIIRVAPSYFTDDIFYAIIDEFTALRGTGLVEFRTIEFNYDRAAVSVDTGLDGTRTPLWVQNAFYDTGKSNDRWQPAKVSLLKDTNTTEFASGYAFQVIKGGRQGYPIRVTVALELGVPTALSDTVGVAALGIDPILWQVVPIGAAWRLLLSKEARRLNPDASHGSRRAEEISPGSISFLGRALQRMREDLLEQALEYRYAQYPPRQDI